MAAKEKRIQLRDSMLIGLFVGASMGTKLFSIFLLPFFLAWIVYSVRKDNPSHTMYFRHVAAYVLGAAILSMPFYAFSYMNTGSPFYSFSQHLEKLFEIGGEGSLLQFLIHRTLTLPISYFSLVLARDYVSPVLIVLTPALWLARKGIAGSMTLRLLCSFAAFQWLMWWYIPPTSTRYALSGFIVLIVLIIWSLLYVARSNKPMRRYLPFILAGAIFLSLAPRLLVAQRSLVYIFGQQTEREYLDHFRDGHIDQHMDRWYGAE
jgi:hypothetical protein